MELRGVMARAVVAALVACGSVGAGEIVQEGFSGRLLVEAGNEPESADARWWLSSGAYFDSSSGAGATVLGRLPTDDRWRVAYSRSNPLDTEEGYRPQNIFRLVNRAVWQDGIQEVFFLIRDTARTESPNRAGHNGILFFSRYADSQNLYYSGVRVDGRAVIKRKRAGAYVTLASSIVFPSSAAYERTTNPNLLPVGRWVGLRSTTAATATGSVRIKLEVLDASVDSEWRTVLQVDDPDPLKAPGHGGLRTDFMDVEFDGYRIESTSSATPTATLAPPTAAPTRTSTPRPTATMTPRPTATVTPRPTSTATPRPTSTPSPRPTATATPRPTATLTPRAVPTATPRPTSTATPSLAAVADPTATPRPIATSTPRPTATATPRPTSTPTVAICSFTASPAEAAFSSNGGSGTIVVQTGASCEWSASASTRWAHPDTRRRRGSGTIPYSIDGNPSRQARSVTIWVGTARVVVRQQGSARKGHAGVRLLTGNLFATALAATR